MSRLLQVLLPALGLGALACPAWAQGAPAAPAAAASAPRPEGPPAAARTDEGELPIVLRARELQVRPDLDATAVGDVDLRRGKVQIRADRLSYDVPEDQARALGHVVVRRDDAIYRGPELQLKVQSFEGFFLQPEFDLLRLQSGGRADRLDFIGSSRAVATRAAYTSCPREDMASLPWVLQADRVRMDFDANEGLAEGGVLRFMDVPILALPVLSFPLSDDRKSGWLPPGLNLDTRSGSGRSSAYFGVRSPVTRKEVAVGDSDCMVREMADWLTPRAAISWAADMGPPCRRRATSRARLGAAGLPAGLTILFNA